MKRYTINWTAKTLYNQMMKGNLNYDNAVQRGLVWDIKKKSKLIHTMLYGYAMPQFFFTKNENGYDCLDGKQRSHAISDYFSCDFALDLEPEDYILDDEEGKVDVSGCTFEQLPEWAQDRIRDYNLSINYYEDMTEEEVREFFTRLNNGKPLTSVELTRVKAKSIHIIKQFAKSEPVQAIVTDKGKSRFNDENIIMQIMGMAFMSNPSFATKDFRPWIEHFVINDEQTKQLENGLHLMQQFLSRYNEPNDNPDNEQSRRKVMRKIKTRSNFVAMVYLGMLWNSDTETYIKTVFDFFNTNTTSTDHNYNNSVGARSASPEAVQARAKVIQNLAA